MVWHKNCGASDYRLVFLSNSIFVILLYFCFTDELVLSREVYFPNRALGPWPLLCAPREGVLAAYFRCIFHIPCILVLTSSPVRALVWRPL